MKMIYDRHLAFYEQAATPEYWDKRWIDVSFDIQQRLEIGISKILLKAVQRFVPRGKRILEAGCGMGGVVYGLNKLGWKCSGVDTAQLTIKRIIKAEPSLDVQVADARQLPFADNTFDCYISVGVIEHFFDGYSEFFLEMDRILRPSGVAIISFPAMNPIRRLKRTLSLYPHFEKNKENKTKFYQFALDPQVVRKDLLRLCYSIEDIQWFEAWLGISDEAPGRIANLFRRIYNNRTSHICSAIRRLSEPFAFITGYCCQIIARKLDDQF